MNRSQNLQRVDSPVAINREMDIFVLLAYDVLRRNQGVEYEWLHTVWSGFNQAFKRRFKGADPVQYTRLLYQRELIELIPTRGGVRLCPRADFLSELAADERDTAAEMRDFLERFHEEREEEQRRRRTRTSPSTNRDKHTDAERAAQELWEKGDMSGALKKIGF